MRYTLKVLSSRDYDKIAERYPVKLKNRIKDSWGFTDTKRKIAFVRDRKDKFDLTGTALHEMLELVADISPHEEDGIRFKGKKPEQPSIQYTQSPEYSKMMELFTKYQEPYLASQQKLYQDVFEPTSRQIGGVIQRDLTEPFQLPEDVWSKVWQKSRERTLGEYAPIEKRMTERFAGTGALDTSGQVQKWFGDVELSKAKSIEDLAVNQAIQEWTEKKMAKQQSIGNAFQFLTGEPQFNVPMPQSMAYIPPVNTNTGNWITGASEGNSKFWSDLMFGSSPEQAAEMAMLGFMMASDRRLKKNIVKIGKTKDGINIYKWNWKKFAKKIFGHYPHVGVIAQEVMKIKPEAVSAGRFGFLMVNYSLL